GTRIRWADEHVPIMLCATGPKNLRLAGALADIAMIYVGVHPASVRWAIDHVRAGAEEAGRDPGERQPHRVRAEVEPRARHARGDDPPRRRARGVRLLRRAPRLVGRAHE